MNTDNTNNWYYTNTTATTTVPSTGFNFLHTGTEWTTTGSIKSLGPPIAASVKLLPDGHIEIMAGLTIVKIPPALFRDLFAFAEMGLLAKLVPEEKDVESR